MEAKCLIWKHSNSFGRSAETVCHGFAGKYHNNFRSTNVGSYHCCRMRALSKVCFSGSCIAKQMVHGLSLQCRYTWSSGCRKWSMRIFDSGSNFDIIWSKNKHLCGRLPFLMLLFFHPTIIGPPAFKEPIPEIV